jgi:hypothetical protein
LGLEIAPKVRFVKKGQKQEQTTDINGEEENTDKAEPAAEEEEDDDDWFKVKEKPDALEGITTDLPELSNKEKKITNTKLAKKLRKKNLLINKRTKYDEDGNVSNSILIIRINLLFIRQLLIQMKRINQQHTISKKQKLVFIKWIEEIKKRIEL